MKILKILVIIFISLRLSATIVIYSELPKDIQKMVIPDVEGKVLINDQDLPLIESSFFSRDLPTVVSGWPVSYTASNCKNGAIYVNMDTDPEMEILFGVGTKVTALNLDGSIVAGWPVQLGFYIWSSPAAGDIDGDGDIEIVCTSRDNSTANSGALYAFELDGTACAGFPVMQSGSGTNNVCLYDLDANGDMEILVNVRNHPQGWIYVFEGDGSLFPGFPQELDYIPGAGISAGDITGDGIPEIVALSYYKIHVYDLSGDLLPGFPLENPGYTYSYSQPILCDIDNDGLREIIWGGCSSSAGAVFAVNEDAGSVAGWPQTTGQWIFGTVSIGDIDQNGSLDIVVGDQVGSGTPMDYIYAWDSAGNAIEGFPAGPTNAIYAQIGIADIDGDGNVELMIDDNAFEAGYNAYNHDGTQCTDWPLACGTVWSSTTMQITPAFGDVDNDGEIEIIGAATDIMNWVVECYLWDTGEAWNEDLAYMIVDGCNIQHNGLYDPSAIIIFNPPNNFSAEVIDYNDILLTWEEPDPTNATLLGYKVYRDGTEIEEIEDPATLTYFDAALNAGSYEYFATAIYENPTGESEPSNTENMEIVFPAPQNLGCEASYPNILLFWDEPDAEMRSLEHYTIYMDDEVFEEVITSTFYIIFPGQLTPGDHDCYVTATYSGGFESGASNVIWIPIPGDADDMVTILTELKSNHPNPFNPTTSISFSLTESAVNTEISVYNSKGQKIKTLVNEIMTVGEHSAIWDGTDESEKAVSSGVYLYKMKSGKYNQIKKMILMK